MSLTLNSTEIPSGSPLYFGQTQLSDISFNGTLVWQYDVTGPEIIVRSSYNDWTGNSQYTLEGSAYDDESGIASVKVNGVTVAIQNYAFSKTINLSSGDNTITISATDTAGNTSTKTIHKYYDALAPQVSITSASGYIASSTYMVTGVASDSQSGLASVTVDGVAVSVGSDGSFARTLYNISGSKTITVVATDNVGRSTTKTVTVTYDTSAHAATLSTSLIVPTYRDADAGGSGGRGASVGSKTITDYYAQRGASNLMDGTGAYVWAKAWFNANVNLTVLPNYTSIKRVVINRYGYGQLVISVNGAASTSFEDYDFSEGTEYQMGHEIYRSAKAGISSLYYYYA